MRNEELLAVIGLGVMTLGMILFLTIIVYLPEV
jgi:hypothetical protein